MFLLKHKTRFYLKSFFATMLWLGPGVEPEAPLASHDNSKMQTEFGPKEY